MYLDKMSNVLQTHLCIFFTCPNFFLKLKQAHPTNLNFFGGGGTHVKTKVGVYAKKRQHWYLLGFATFWSWTLI